MIMFESDLRQAIYRILDSYGYRVESADAIIIAVRGKSHVMIGITEPDEKITADFIARYLTSVGNLIGKRVIVTLQPVEKNIAKQLREHKITVWDRKSIEIEIGKIVVEDLISTSATEKIVYEEAALPEDTIKAEIEQREDVVLKWPKKVGDEHIVKPIMTVEDVRELARHPLRGFQYELKLVPFYVYEYRCVVTVAGKGGEEEERRCGLIGVNALTEECKEWKISLDNLLPELQHALKLEPQIDEERAATLAHELAVMLNTTEIELVKDRGSAVIFEKKKVAPKDGIIELIRKGLIYLPIWCVQGAHGVMIVNAATGKIIQEEFYSGMSSWTDV